MDSGPTIIYHLTPVDYYNSLPTNQPYVPREFERDGFIHCTKGEERVLLVANTVYRRAPGDFLALVIDQSKVTAPVKYENVGGILFPHIYGPLNRDAIVRVLSLGRREDGTFLPFGEPDPGAEREMDLQAQLSTASTDLLLAGSAELRARAETHLARIEQDIAALKKELVARDKPASTPTPPAEQASAPEPTAQAGVPEAAAPEAVKIPVSNVPVHDEGLESRLERMERELAGLKEQIEQLNTRLGQVLESQPARASRRRASPKPAKGRPKH